MLNRFLSIQVDLKGKEIPKEQTLNYIIFSGGKIKLNEKEKNFETSKLIIKDPTYLNEQGKYPVIFIDFSECKGVSFEKV